MQAGRGQRACGQAHVPAHFDSKNARNPPLRGRARGREDGWHPPRKSPTLSRQVNQMDYIPSVSRSSGIDKDGDSLKDFRTQEAYWEFIHGKLTAFWKEYLSQPVCQNEFAKRKCVESQTNVLILFRKLREGLLSSGRNDHFSLQVYETSLYLSIMFESSVGILDTTSILSRLVPGMYTAVLQPLQSSQLSSSLPPVSPALSSASTQISPTFSSSRSSPPRSRSPSRPSASLTAILMLLHTLILTYPSQRAYFDALQSIPECILDRKSDTYGWIRAVARCLRGCDFVEFEDLTKGSGVLESVTSVGDVKGVDSNLDPKLRLADSKPDSNLDSHSTSVSNSHLRKAALSEHISPSQHKPDLPQAALRVLLSRLRAKARDHAWVVFRSAYREMSEEDELKRWLERYLALESVEGASLEGMEERVSLGLGKITFDDWIRERERDGHIRRREGVVGRWVVCKVRQE
ncbi:hypothetical protein EV401DRAFT_209343 [Pisolithus croceorrhizus]|nr:hypothetical protein EV401DRAFT_209343 [Pisolithus croceorrhizus]